MLLGLWRNGHEPRTGIRNSSLSEGAVRGDRYGPLLDRTRAMNCISSLKEIHQSLFSHKIPDEFSINSTL